VSSTTPSDTFRGIILQNGLKVDEIEGSWINEIRSNGKVLYDVRKQQNLLAEYAESPLPSDSRFRPDLDALAHGDFGLAQAKKMELEELQRKDRLLRKQGYEQREESYKDSENDTDSNPGKDS
jgi:hypothetical protein